MTVASFKPTRMRHALRAGVIAAAFTVGGLGTTAHAQAAYSSPSPEVAIKAVQATLPSVAILGQKDGPAGTTEVFIQVPGVLNMQSVYVLQDGETVISGVVVPPVKNGFPGSQLSLPDGKASVDPRSPRQGVDQLNEVLGVSSGQTRKANSGTEKDFSVPALPREKKTVSAEAPAPESVPAPEVAAATTANAPDRAEGATEETGSAKASPVKEVSDDSAVADSAGNEMVIESLDDIAETGAFSQAVRKMLKDDSDINALRKLSGTEKQADEYLKLVKSLPSVKQGDADKAIYVMFDPNCPVCHRYYNELQPKIRSGILEVNWIPAIVFSNERSSLTSSAALLAEIQREGGTPLDMMNAMMTEPGYTSKIDGAPNVDRLVPYLESVVKNTAIMAMVRATTPLVVFENVEGELAVNPGIPDAGYESLIRSENG